MTELNKIHLTRFAINIENIWKNNNNPTSLLSLDFDISELATCHLEVHTSQQELLPIPEFTDLVFRIDAPTFKTSKNRLVNVAVGSLHSCFWFDTFEYNGPKELIKKDFFNDIMNEYGKYNAPLILRGVVKVTEYDWSLGKVSVLLTDDYRFNIAKERRSLERSWELSDFNFIVEKRELRVHKSILIARSPVFNKQFSGSYIKASATYQEIIDISADTFEEFLYFIYTGVFRNPDFPVEVDCMVELMIVADRYEVVDLLKLCEIKLLTSINEDNAEAIYTMASQIQCNTELKKVAFQILQSKSKHFTIALPAILIDAPDIVHRSNEMKKHFSTGTSEAEIDKSKTSLAVTVNSGLPSDIDVTENPTEDESA